jgi:hypothetical protein
VAAVAAGGVKDPVGTADYLARFGVELGSEELHRVGTVRVPEADRQRGIGGFRLGDAVIKGGYIGGVALYPLV